MCVFDTCGLGLDLTCGLEVKSNPNPQVSHPLVIPNDKILCDSLLYWYNIDSLDKILEYWFH